MTLCVVVGKKIRYELE